MPARELMPIEPAQDGHSRAYLLAFTAAILLALMGLATINFTADPHDQFQHQVVPPVVINDLSLKVRQLETMDEFPEVVLFGSSRSLALNATMGDQRGYNFAVGSSYTEDATILYEWLAAEQIPRTVIMGFDLSREVDVNHPSPLADSWAYEEVVGKPGSAATSAWSRTTNLLDYQTSLDSAWATLIHVGIKDRPTPKWTYSADGQRNPDGYESGSYQPEIVVQDPDPFDRTDHNDWSGLHHFIQTALNHGSEVIVFLTPEHPDAVAAHSTHPLFEQSRQEVITLLEGYCPDIRFIDLTEVDAWGGDPDLFYDRSHYFGPARAQVMDAIASAPSCEDVR